MLSRKNILLTGTADFIGSKLDSQVNPIEREEEFGIIIPYWKDSLDACLRVMGERR